MAYKLINNPLFDYIRSHLCVCVVLLYSKASSLCYTVACKPNLYVYALMLGCSIIKRPCDVKSIE